MGTFDSHTQCKTCVPGIEIFQLMISIIGLYFLNHLIVTLIRIYTRSEKLKYLSHIDDFNKVGSFKIGFERRVLRPLTFTLALLLTLGEYITLSLFVL